MLAPSDNPAIFVKEVVEHHLSFKKLIKVPLQTVQEVWSRIVSQNYLISVQIGHIDEDLYTIISLYFFY